MKTQKEELSILKCSEGELSNQIHARFQSEFVSKDTNIERLMTQVESYKRDIDSIHLNHRKQILDLKHDKVL